MNADKRKLVDLIGIKTYITQSNVLYEVKAFQNGDEHWAKKILYGKIHNLIYIQQEK